MSTTVAPPVTWNPAAPAVRRGERSLRRGSRPLVWFLIHNVLRNRRDVFRVPGLGYVITSAAACREAYLRQDLFAKDGDQSAGVIITQVVGETALLNMDGEKHRVLRKQLIGLFTPKFVNDVCERALGDITADITARLQAGEAIDIARIARRVTGTMMLHMVGFEVDGVLDRGATSETMEDRALRMFDLGRQLIDMVPSRVTRLDPATVATGKAILDQLVDGVEEVYAHGADTTIPGRMRELGLTFEETRSVVGMLLIAGTETTASGLARIVGLLNDTHQWSRLQADRSLMQGAIDEGLRLTTPVPVSTRTTVKEEEFYGTKIKPGKLVFIALTRAMRDPKVIERGDDFDIGRTQPRELRQLWFGAGPHFCLGFSLANREIATVLEAMLDAVPDIEIVERTASKQVLLPSWERMMVRATGVTA
jgi:cytochrome P450